jgi:hypothetical protein
MIVLITIGKEQYTFHRYKIDDVGNIHDTMDRSSTFFPEGTYKLNKRQNHIYRLNWDHFEYLMQLKTWATDDPFPFEFYTYIDKL